MMNVEANPDALVTPQRFIREEDLPVEHSESHAQTLRRIVDGARLATAAERRPLVSLRLSRNALIDKFDHRLHELLDLVPHVVQLLPDDRIASGLLCHRDGELRELVGLLLPSLSLVDRVGSADQMRDGQLLDQPRQSKDLGVAGWADRRIAVVGGRRGHRIVSSAAELARRTVAGLSRLINRGA